MNDTSDRYDITPVRVANASEEAAMSQLQDQLFLKPSDVAQRLNVHRSTIYSWMDDGTLPSVWVGPKVRRIPAGAFEVYLRRLERSEQAERAGISELVGGAVTSPVEAGAAFLEETGITAQEFSDRWRQGTIEDTADNTRLALRALAIKTATTERQPA